MAKRADQQAARRANRYEDQHGRGWFATIEIETGDPTGPIDLVVGDLPIHRDPPLVPPQKYLHVDSTRDFRKLTIRYDQWIRDLKDAKGAYQEEMWFHANRLFGDKAAEAMENPPPALLQVVGKPPQDERPVIAAREGDEWVLGLTAERPSWADRIGFHPYVRESRRVVGDEDLAFLQDETEYPENYAPGRWRLSNGDTMQGTREDAEAAQDSLASVAAA